MVGEVSIRGVDVGEVSVGKVGVGVVGVGVVEAGEVGVSEVGVGEVGDSLGGFCIGKLMEARSCQKREIEMNGRRGLRQDGELASDGFVLSIRHRAHSGRCPCDTEENEPFSICRYILVPIDL